MVENSETLARSEEQHTKKGSKPKTRVTTEQALEILQESLIAYQQAGGRVDLVPEFYYAGQRFVAVMLPGVHYIDGNLVPVMANRRDDQ